MKKNNLNGKYILITGASTGIGRSIAEYLASHHINVIACARKSADIEILSQIPHIRGLRLDVTQTEEIRAVARLLKNENISLFAIINNAGIAVGGPMIFLPESEIQDCFAVNCVGPVNVIRELFPLLEDHGCIVNISSMGARYVTPWMAPYHMAKIALEAYSDSLRMELAPLGIRVIVIEPGAIKTDASQKEDRFIRHIQGTFYQDAFKIYWDAISNQHKSALNPKVIATTVFQALQTPNPRHRYLIPHRKVIIPLWLLFAKWGITDAIYTNFMRRHVKPVSPKSFLNRIK